MEKYGGWEIVRRLGEGGQSEVHFVRSPSRVAGREESAQAMRAALDRNKMRELADAVWSYARPDSTSEVGALKAFKISPKGSISPPPGSDGSEAIERLRNEIRVLTQNWPALPKLLDSNEDERWIVTEYFPEGTFEHQLSRYRGKPIPALRAFRSLVTTVASLHRDGYVHRDIKPANVFVRKDDELILGDFGIVYVPPVGERLTVDGERVGPRDYMPPWGDLGERQENVQPNFDVYMLGKFLWCMIAGKLKLPREYHKRPPWNLAMMFPETEQMHLINSILSACVVEEPDKCLPSAHELLGLVDDTLATFETGAPLLNQNGELHLPCRVCGKGSYQDAIDATLHLPLVDQQGNPRSPMHVRALICNVCAHYELFSTGNPHEAAKRGWKPWR